MTKAVSMAKKENIMDKLLAILRTTCPGIDFENETGLVDKELIDSLDVVTIVSEIMGTFGIELNVEDIIPENFNSAQAMMDLINERSR